MYENKYNTHSAIIYQRCVTVGAAASAAHIRHAANCATRTPNITGNALKCRQSPTTRSDSIVVWSSAASTTIATVVTLWGTVVVVADGIWTGTVGCCHASCMRPRSGCGRMRCLMGRWGGGHGGDNAVRLHAILLQWTGINWAAERTRKHINGNWSSTTQSCVVVNIQSRDRNKGNTWSVMTSNTNQYRHCTIIYNFLNIDASLTHTYCIKYNRWPINTLDYIKIRENCF